MSKKFLMNAGFTAAVMLGVFALPGHADTTLSFSNSGTSCATSCGTATGSGTTGSGTISSFDDEAFNTLQVKVNGVAVETWLLTGVNFTDSNNSYSVGFTANCSSGCAGTTNFSGSGLITFNTPSLTYIGNSSTESFNVVNTATNLYESSTLLTDLKLTAYTGTFNGSFGGSTIGNFVTNATEPLNYSSTLTVESVGQLVTPEPVSFLLFGTGLLAIGIVARQKHIKAVEQKV